MRKVPPPGVRACCLPSHEGSGLKFSIIRKALEGAGLPSHEGSGLK